MAEKFAAENVIGAADVPTEPLVDASTTVLAPTTEARDPLMSAPEIIEIEPPLALMLLLVSEIAALAPVACNTILLPLIVLAAANDITLETAAGANVSLKKYVPVLEALFVPVTVTA